jgi:hypothetical protein
MKYIFKFLALVFVLMILGACTEDDSAIEPQNFQINFDIIRNDPRSETDAAGNSVIMQVETTAGVTVLDQQRVDITPEGAGFLTAPLRLPPGNYRITEFTVIGDHDQPLYALPKKSSPLADQVSNPADIPFTIIPARSPAIMLEVIDVSKNIPEDYGYGRRSAAPQLSLMVYTEGDPKPTTAEAYVMQAGDTIHHYMLNATANHLPVSGDHTLPYKVIVVKQSFGPYTIDFTYSDLIQKNGQKPFKVMLAPAFTMLAFIDFDVSDLFHFMLAGTDGTITINWGDGVSEVYALAPDHLELDHTYATPGNHMISITGDLSSIGFFYSAYGQGMIDSVDFSRLTNLRELRFLLSRSPAVLDLSHNSKLEFAMLAGLHDLRTLILGENQLRWLMLHGPNQMMTTSLDAVIGSLYHNAVAGNITNGWFGFAATWYQEETDETAIASPSPDGLEKMRILKAQYGWSFSPDLLD